MSREKKRLLLRTAPLTHHCLAGSNCPSILPIHQQRELCQLSVAAVKCMGFTVGTFHVECKYTSKNGPQLIEVLRTASLLLAFCQELSVDISETVHFMSAYQFEICNEE